jgi:amino acid adenylation domain-containing protein
MIKPPTGTNSRPVDGATLSWRSLDSDEERCHAVRYELDTLPDLDACKNQLRRSSYGPFPRAESKIWVEEFGFSSACELANGLRAAEMSRPVSPQNGWRAVFLLFDDRRCDLILVANRLSCDLNTLARLSRVLATPRVERRCMREEPQRERFAPPAKADRSTAGRAQVPGGLEPADLAWAYADGEDTSTIVESSKSATFSRIHIPELIAAVGLSLAAYCEVDVSVVSVLLRQPQGETGLPARDGLALVSVDTKAASVAQLVDSVRVQLENPLWSTGDPGGRSAAGGTTEDRCAAVVWDFPGAELGAFRHYTPFLRTPFLLNFVPMPGENQREGCIRCVFSGRRLRRDVLECFAETVWHVYRQMGNADRSPTEIRFVPRQRDREDELRGLDVRAERIDVCIARNAEAHPTKTAVISGEQELTFGELNERAEAVAACFVRLGCRPGGRVGIFIERSWELVVVMLAAMKAGAAYVPIDETCPAERVRYIAEDAEFDLLVYQGDRRPPGIRRHTVEVAELLAMAAESGPWETMQGITADDEAYVIYTSGSTGKPNGVSVAHRNVIMLTRATQPLFDLTPDDVWTMFHSPAFDFSVWEVWVCLLTGGTLVIVPYMLARSTDKFHELLRARRVSVLSQTPTAFERLVEMQVRPARTAVRLVVFGGEPLNPRMLLPWMGSTSDTQCKLVNMYGITETTVHVTAHTVTRRDALNGSRSVGRPIPGWRICVMDAHGRELPSGAAGEIWVGGAGVTDGYLNRAELTRSHFMVLPELAGRAYRTGDRGRLDASGRLEYLGRIDNQVKLRGYRIELNEIRSVLLDTPGVKSAAVALTQRGLSESADKVIAAFVVLGEGNTDDVRKYVQRFLPSHMVPGSFSQVESIPLTANGKVDIKSLLSDLPKTHEARTVSRASDVRAPEVLRAVLSEILSCAVDDNDNFFDLGGNSLYAMRVVTELKNRGIDSVNVRDIYTRQNFRELAKALEPDR